MIDKPGASPERIWWSAHHPSHRFAVGQLGHRQLLHPAHNCCWVSSMCKTCVTKMGFAQNRFILKLFNSWFGSCQWVSKSCSWGPGWSIWCAAGSASCNECGWLVIYPYKIVYIYIQYSLGLQDTWEMVQTGWQCSSVWCAAMMIIYIYTRWCPPVISWFIDPTNYRSNPHKP